MFSVGAKAPGPGTKDPAKVQRRERTLRVGAKKRVPTKGTGDGTVVGERDVARPQRARARSQDLIRELIAAFGLVYRASSSTST